MKHRRERGKTTLKEKKGVKESSSLECPFLDTTKTEGFVFGWVLFRKTHDKEQLFGGPCELSSIHFGLPI